jgi:hypothetical protein
MLSKVVLVLAIALGGLVAVVATRPDRYHVERAVDVGAPAAAVFAEIDDLRAWSAWSPWERRDPAMKKTFSPVTSGVGASYAWEGNKEVGKGRMTITESHPGEKVAQRLEFIEPFASTADIAFSLKAAGPSSTHVTWSMDGRNNFMGKAFSLVMDMDKVIGKDFEAGLAGLKQIAEAKAVAAAAAAPPTPPLPPAPGPPAPGGTK